MEFPDTGHKESLYRFYPVGIERREGFIRHQELRFNSECPCKSKPLSCVLQT